MLELRDLSFRYNGSAEGVLRGVDLRIEPGEVVLILGESGSGKSTLAGLVAGTIGREDGAISGEVRLSGEEVSALRQRGEAVAGLVQQDPEAQMVTLNVEDEIAFGPENLRLDPREIRERVQWALGAVGGETLIERSIPTLSGGEKQRIAIASMLAMRPPVLMLDEPTSSLDPKGAAAVAHVIRKMKEDGMVILVLEHRFRWLEGKIDRSYIIEQGRLRGLDQPSITRTARQERRIPRAGSGGGALLRVEGVSYRYDGTKVLDRVNLELRSGEITGVMGDNGSGKTTLLMVMMGILDPSEGHVVFAGKRIRSRSDLARHIGLVFQNPNSQILESTVADEVLFAPRNMGMEAGEADTRLVRVLQELGLQAYRDVSPYRLSLGEKRRLNVASVAVYEPEVYLLDEPFVGQDPGNVEAIVSALRTRLKEGASTLVVSHDPDFIEENCDRVVFLSGGRVLHQGSSREVFQKLAEEGEAIYLPAGWTD